MGLSGVFSDCQKMLLGEFELGTRWPLLGCGFKVKLTGR